MKDNNENLVSMSLLWAPTAVLFTSEAFNFCDFISVHNTQLKYITIRNSFIFIYLLILDIFHILFYHSSFAFDRIESTWECHCYVIFFFFLSHFICLFLNNFLLLLLVWIGYVERIEMILYFFVVFVSQNEKWNSDR